MSWQRSVIFWQKPTDDAPCPFCNGLNGEAGMKKIIDYFQNGKFEELLGSLAIIVVIVPVTINVVKRTFFGNYSVTLEAIALLAYVWIGYGFFGYLYKKDAHVDVKFIVQKASSGTRKFLDFLRDVIILIISVYLFYWGCKLFRTNINRYATGTKIPLAVGYASIIFGYGTAAIRCMVSIGRRLFHSKQGGGKE
jgi:TRAP-type C4-dicarboxylate transport system permease small subunit